MEYKIELLSPAGDTDSLIAAVKAGADAVYFGVEGYGARAGAKNISLEELEHVLLYMKLMGVKSYVAFNTLYSDHEIEKLVKDVEKAVNSGCDAVIVQDLGLMNILIKNGINVHASTQMSVGNFYGARLLQNAGVQRIVMARESPLQEYKYISDNLTVETECFVHGALCVCVSGQCLMSSFIGKRSGNRGTCAQPCRKKYSIIDAGGNVICKSSYILSPKDLKAINFIDDMKKFRVKSLKIEGRLKGSDYVAVTTKAYRDAIDGQTYDTRHLDQIFNRGFTDGINNGQFGSEYLTVSSAGHIGVKAAKLISYNKSLLKFRSECYIRKNDSISILSEDGTKTGFKVDSDIKKGEVYSKRIFIKSKPLSDLYRAESVETSEYAESLQDKKRKFYVDIELELRLDEPARAKIEFGNFKYELKYGPVVDKAINKPMTEEMIQRAMKKMGDSEFELKGLKIYMDEDVFLSKASLNEIRRDLIKGLSERINRKNKVKISIEPVPDICNKKNDSKKVSLYLKEPAYISSAYKDSIHRIYGIFSDEDIFKLKKHYINAEIFLPIPYLVEKNDLDKFIECHFTKNFDGLLASDLSALQKAIDCGVDIATGSGLNVCNKHSIKFLENLGAETIALSNELRVNQLKNLFSTKSNLEMQIFGCIEVMKTKSCPASIFKGCRNDNACLNCEFKEGYRLKDEKNYAFPFYRSFGCTTIMNSSFLCLDEGFSKLNNVNIYMMDMRMMKNTSDIELAVINYANVLFGNSRTLSREFLEHIKYSYGGYTGGHFKKGVFEV